MLDVLDAKTAPRPQLLVAVTREHRRQSLVRPVERRRDLVLSEYGNRRTLGNRHGRRVRSVEQRRRDSVLLEYWTRRTLEDRHRIVVDHSYYPLSPPSFPAEIMGTSNELDECVADPITRPNHRDPGQSLVTV